MQFKVTRQLHNICISVSDLCQKFVCRCVLFLKNLCLHLIAAMYCRNGRVLVAHTTTHLHWTNVKCVRCQDNQGGLWNAEL